MKRHRIYSLVALHHRCVGAVVMCGVVLLSQLPWGAAAALGQHQHAHGEHGHGSGDEPVERPKVFLDKSPRIVAYQLKRLDNERLLLVERKNDDAKYVPVYTAILTRAGMSPQYRDEAVAALAKLNKSSVPAELLDALGKMDTDDDPQQLRTGEQLAKMLLRQSQQQLRAAQSLLLEAIAAESRLLRSVGYAALATAGESQRAHQLASASDQAKLDWLGSIPLIPHAAIRGQQRMPVAALLADSEITEVRSAAATALASIPNERADTFARMAALIDTADLRTAAVRTMLQVATDDRHADISRQVLDALVEFAEATPAAQRTTDEFVDAMQLADQLLAKTEVERAKTIRERLRKITVRVVRIHTVEEEMRYDIPYFAVEAGRPVQIVLKNEDLMPHNLVVTIPDALQEVAQLGLEVGPEGHGGKAYVPDSDKVLFATQLVPSLSQERLTFTAPAVPGEYPFVCTFPRHWMRMYGVMIVTEDLDAWNREPTVPKDPVGSKRALVQKWALDDLKPDLDGGLRGRSFEIGGRLFKEATCAQCHKVRGEGGAVGPELTEVFKRWKGNREAVLREILEPSYRIDDKYAVHLLRTEDGEVITGIIQSEDDDKIAILDNPRRRRPEWSPRRSRAESEDIHIHDAQGAARPFYQRRDLRNPRLPRNAQRRRQQMRLRTAPSYMGLVANWSTPLHGNCFSRLPMLRNRREIDSTTLSSWHSLS